MDHNQGTKNIVILKWQYTPIDFFEEPVLLKREAYTLKIERGSAEARINPDFYDKNLKRRNEIHSVLNSRFLGVQLINHRTYKLLMPSENRQYPDGRNVLIGTIETEHIKISEGQIDVIITDRNGNIITDTRRERIKEEKAIVDLIEKYHQDPLLQKILESFNEAMNNPANEMVYLYEIREALETKFGKKMAVPQLLGLDQSDWIKFGTITNNDPIKPSRHRGTKTVLREPTHQELRKVRKIAGELIKSYLKYLEKENPV